MTRSIMDFDIKKVTLIGFSAGMSAVLVALVGMFEGLNGRMLIAPVLTLAYLMLVAFPFTAGYLAAKETVLEGLETPQKGPRDLAAGATAGLIFSGCLIVLVLLLQSVDFSNLMPNWRGPTHTFLTFSKGSAKGITYLALIGSIFGALGGAMHVVSRAVRSTLSIVVQVVVYVAVLEALLDDLLEGFGLDALSSVLYERRGGLTLPSAIALAGLALLVSIGVRRLRSKSMAKDDVPATPVGRFIRQINGGPKLNSDDRRTITLIAFVLTVAATVVLPFFLGKIVNELLANVGMFILLALGLNIVVGLAGILDLGYVAFFAVGAYTMAILTSPLSPFFAPEMTFWGALPIVIVAAAIVGILIGTPVIRMRGDYLAIVTLGFGEIIRILFLSDWLGPFFGGAQGIRSIPGVPIGPTELNGTDPRGIFFLVAAFLAIAIYVSWKLERSRLGRAWMAIREDEEVAEAMGINTVTAKLFAFVVGAILASFSGAIFAVKVGSVFPNSFKLLVSIIILVVVIVGGIGNIPGVIIGAVVLIGVLGGPTQPGLLQELSQYKLLVYGALLIFMMLAKPEGLVPSAVRNRELHGEEAEQDAWLKGAKPGTEEEVEV